MRLLALIAILAAGCRPPAQTSSPMVPAIPKPVVQQPAPPKPEKVYFLSLPTVVGMIQEHRDNEATFSRKYKGAVCEGLLIVERIRESENSFELGGWIEGDASFIVAAALPKSNHEILRHKKGDRIRVRGRLAEWRFTPDGPTFGLAPARLVPQS